METPNPLTQTAAGHPAGAAAPPDVPPAALTASKEAVFGAVDRRVDEAVDCLRQLIRCPSTRGETNGAQGLIAAALRRMGLRVAEVGIDNGAIADLPGYSPAEWSYDGLVQVVGTLSGSGGGRSVVLNGHVDVVSAEPVAHWRHDPWGAEVVDGRLYGRGACDMKAGIVALLYAVQAIRDAGLVLQGDVVVQSVIDEECGGNGTLSLLAQGYRGDAAIVAEPSGLGFSTATLRRPL